MAPHEIYPSKDDDSWVSIAVNGEEEWRVVLRAPSANGRNSPATLASLPSPTARSTSPPWTTTVAAWTRERSNIEATHLLQRAGIAAAPAYKVSELFHDPHDIARRTSIDVRVDELDAADVTYGIPWRLSETPGAVRGLGRPLGTDNERFYRDELALPPEEVERLIERQVIY